MKMKNPYIFNKSLLWILYLSCGFELSNCDSLMSTNGHLTEWNNISTKQRSTGCILPPHILHGKFQLTAGFSYQENTPVSSSTGVHLTCDSGYNSTLYQVFFCLVGTWIPDIQQSRCTRACPSLMQSDTYTAVCRHNGTIVSCDTSVEGTIADIKCNPSFTYEVKSISSCQDGRWDPYPAPCHAACTDSLLENLNQDMTNLSSINHKNNMAVTNSIKLHGFPCDSDKCLDSSFVCDGLKDCVDGSDETEGYCASIKCPSFLFRCKYGACIPKANVCNGEANCADGSDEDTFECAENRSLGFCNNYEFRCMDGGCIDKFDVCDGFMNCADGSDETQETCAGILCPSYLFKCRYGACVEKSARCNYINDCVDGSDEEDCNFDSTEIFDRMPWDNERIGCVFPQHPAHGKYGMTPTKTYSVGTYVNFGTSLNLKCSVGYAPFTLNFTCSRNGWHPSLDEGRCLRKCSPLSLSAAYTVYCSLIKERVNCSNSIAGTIARVNCRSDYVTTTEINSELVCLSNGSWSQTLKPCKTNEFVANCVLPPHPLHGKYKLLNGNYYQENATTTAVQIMLVCDQGYVHLINHWFYLFGYMTVSNGSQFFQCDNGQWSPRPEKIACSSTCPTLHETASYEVECELEGRNVPCKNPVDNTKATLNCKPFYNSNYAKEILFCQEGKWNPQPTPCQPECGQKNVNAGPLIIGGSDTMVGEYPWVVAVYDTTQDNRHVCSGSIISRYYVISAAHCFTDKEGKPYRKDFFTIVAGKYYRSFSRPENDTQIRKIKNLFVHVDYKGMLDSHRDDIALIEVDQFELTLKVQLVCVDWKEELHYFPENTKTVVTGWGQQGKFLYRQKF